MSEAISPAPETAAFDSGGIAMDIALEEARSDPALRRTVETYLQRQIRLADIQEHHLLKQFSLAQWEKRLGVFLRLATAVVGVAAAVTVGAMVWDASHSNGLIVEPFGVPPDLAARGLTGQAVASQMLDKLAAMQEATDSSRAPQSYANNWGNNLKVEIPETGVSIEELRQFLKDWLGHDTRINGEVWRTQTGITVTARSGGQIGASFAGPESDFDGLMQKAAEHVYSVTQPYRYANFLDRAYNAPDISDRATRASAIYRKLIAGPNVQERAWAWNGLGTIELFVKADPPSSLAYFRKAIATDPDNTMGYLNIALEGKYGLVSFENALAASLQTKRLLDRSNVTDLNPKSLSLRRLQMDGAIAELKGDYREALRNNQAGADIQEYCCNIVRGIFISDALRALAFLHDGRGVRVYMHDLALAFNQPERVGNRAVAVAKDLEDWPALREMEKITPESDLRRGSRNSPHITAALALAHAHTGDVAGAEVLIASSPADCDDCMIARGQIADMHGQHGRADRWFAQVEKAEASVPFADSAWGKALLERGQPDAAIEKFKLSNEKGPHFADPLEGWGEALMAKNQSHRALEKFAEAEKYAPNWGRLHLKWGEALAYSGKKDEAAKQFSHAAALDLTPSEKSELARFIHV